MGDLSIGISVGGVIPRILFSVGKTSEIRKTKTQGGPIHSLTQRYKNKRNRTPGAEDEEAQKASF